MTLLSGLVASALAAFAIAAWLAIGAAVLRPRRAPDAITLAGCVTAGAATTSLAFAILARAGIVAPAVLAVSALSLIAIVARRGDVAAHARFIGDTLRGAARAMPAGRWILGAAGAILWTLAIAPPRDADVLHYHLGHIRQIVRDGGWTPLPEVSYALPFGWSLNFLPFELVGLPQGAGLLSFALWWIVLAVLLRAVRDRIPRPLQLPACLLFLAHPYVFRIFSSAFADAWAILLVALAVTLLRDIRDSSPRETAFLGFVAWIGIASRYQLAAIGIAVTLIAIVVLGRRRRWSSLGRFAAGAAAAAAFALPFPLTNLERFGNPIWPLMIGEEARLASYTNEVGAWFMNSMSLPLSARTIAMTARQLFTDAALAPLPLVLALLIGAASLFARGRERRAGITGAVYLVLWAALSPRLYPTHMLPLVALGPILIASLWPARLLSNARAAANASLLAAAAAGVLVVASAAASTDYLRYVLDGDDSRFHRFTWYYPVYDWVSRSTPADAGFLVIVRSGQTYYLDRRNRTADPWLSAEIDWREVDTPVELAIAMRSRGLDYLVIDWRDWRRFPAGGQMTSTILSAQTAGILEEVHKVTVPLYYSRVFRLSRPATVSVLRLVPG